MQAVRFIHITDTHIGPTEDFVIRGASSFPRAKKIVEIINAQTAPIDFVLHTGDVISDDNAASYAMARKVFEDLRYPIYYVAGNHDENYALKTALQFGPHTSASFADKEVVYSFEYDQTRFVVLDASGDRKILNAQGFIKPEQFAYLEERLQTAPANGLALCVHYPALQLDCSWANRIMLIQNGEELHQLLVKYSSKVRGVFFGHVHRGIQVYRDGILYCTTPSTAMQFHVWPQLDEPEFDLGYHLSFNYVSISAQSTIIKECCFPNAI